MRTVPFPVVGAIAPAVTATVLWWVTGSTFALLGAVIAPTMVVAHYLDALRRAKAEAARDSEARSRREALASEGERRNREREVAELNRQFPSLSDISAHLDWIPRRDGSTQVRVGHCGDGSPWLIDIAGGLAVAGSGAAADAVWATVTFNVVAGLGEPLTREGAWRWANGVILVRGESDAVGTAIRCAGDSVVSMSLRGHIPVTGDWTSDDVSRIDIARGRLRVAEVPQLSVRLSDEQPHILVAGRTGSGKSRVLTALVVDWATRFSPSELTFIGIDFKGGATLAPLAALPHHLATITDLDSTIVPRALAGIAHEMRRRESIFARRGISGISLTSGIPRLAIVIDEVHEFLRQHPPAHDVLADIARRGRSLGIHLVLSVQHPAGVLRESVLGNVPVRICLSMNTSHDSAQVLGRVPPTGLERGKAWCAPGDGSIYEVSVPEISTDAIAHVTGVATGEPPWRSPLTQPVPRAGRVGFGVMDDLARARYVAAEWNPADGDVVVIGDAGSGRTTALRSLIANRPATWVSSLSDLHEPTGIVVVDDLDRIVETLGPVAAGRFIDELVRVRLSRGVHAVAVGTSRPLPRTMGSFRNVLTLRTVTLEEHRASGAPPETFDPAAAPGVGTWRGLRCVVYASTDSSDTASIP